MIQDILEKDERRLFDRTTARFPAKFKDTRDDFGSNVMTRDISASGAHISTKEHLFRNDSVAVEVELPDGLNPITIRGQVIWTKRFAEESWDVGLKFHKISLMKMSRLFDQAQRSV